jgi:RNA polymerase sigma-70 factor, ECF subfamily
VLRKLDQFRGESRFTTWAAKFAILEVSNKVGRNLWRKRGVHLDPDAWDQMPDRFGLYKMLFDARRKLRTELVANGYLDS